MATATKTSVQKPGTYRNESVSIDTGAGAVPTSDVGTRIVPTPTPTLQDSLNADPLPGTTRTDSVGTQDSNTDLFLIEVSALGTLIRTQTRVMVGYMVLRGDRVRAGVNLKLLKGRSSDSRNKLRTVALELMETAAKAAYDPSVESKPHMGRWVALSVLASFYPDAVSLPSVSAAEVFAGVFTRIDPPSTWDSPDLYELKRQYRLHADAIGRLITTAGAESWTKEQVKDALEILLGKVDADPTKTPTPVDPIANARALAASVMSDIIATTVDASTFMDEIQIRLSQYDYHIVAGRTPEGVATFKTVHAGRTKPAGDTADAA